MKAVNEVFQMFTIFRLLRYELSDLSFFFFFIREVRIKNKDGCSRGNRVSYPMR